MSETIDLQAMRDVGLLQADKDTLADLKDISIDRTKPAEERVEDYIRQAGNPFLVRCGDYVLKFGYMDTEKGMDDRMAEYIAKMAKLR